MAIWQFEIRNSFCRRNEAHKPVQHASVSICGCYVNMSLQKILTSCLRWPNYIACVPLEQNKCSCHLLISSWLETDQILAPSVLLLYGLNSCILRICQRNDRLKVTNVHGKCIARIIFCWLIQLFHCALRKMLCHPSNDFVQPQTVANKDSHQWS